MRTFMSRPCVLGGAIAALSLATGAARASVIIVNHLDDTDDGGCTAAHCSLREAVNLAETLPWPDEIYFDIPGPAPHEIVLKTDLPWIEDTVIIDGGEQPGGGPGIGIVLDGGSMNSAILRLRAPGCQIRGLALDQAPLGIFVDSWGDGATIERNWIGLRADGDHGSYVFSGIQVFSADDVHIGGTLPEQRNVIAGYDDWGIFVYSDEWFGNPTVVGLVVQGNYIGTDPTGQFTADAADPPGEAAIELDDHVVDALIGGDGPGAGNLIAGSAGMGIRDYGTGSVIVGNTIGENINGDPLPNGHTGILLGGCGALVNQNIVAHNGAYAKVTFMHGIAVVGDNPCGNHIVANSIYDNVGLGIALGSCNWKPPLDNDLLDRDNGANYLQNYPIISSAYLDKYGNTQIRIELHSTPLRDYEVELYASSYCDPSDHGEGEVPLTTIVMATDASGDAGPWWVTLPWDVPEGSYITATATSNEFPSKGTSEFSPCRRLDPPPR